MAIDTSPRRGKALFLHLIERKLYEGEGKDEKGSHWARAGLHRKL